MPRYRTREAADKKIKELSAKIERTMLRLKKMEDELKRHIADKEMSEVKELYAAFKRSNKTYDQMMTFLGRPVRRK